MTNSVADNLENGSVTPDDSSADFKIEYFKAASADFGESNNPENIEAFNKHFNHLEALQLRRIYYSSHYGRFALSGLVFGITTTLLSSCLLNPAFIPFVLAATTSILPTLALFAVLSLVSALAIVSGTVLFQKSFNELSKLLDRCTNQNQTTYDRLLLGSIALSGISLVTMMYAFPTLLPTVLGLNLATLSTYPKAAAAAGIATVSAASAYYALFGRKPDTVDTLYSSDSNLTSSAFVDSEQPSKTNIVQFSDGTNQEEIESLDSNDSHASNSI